MTLRLTSILLGLPILMQFCAAKIPSNPGTGGGSDVSVIEGRPRTQCLTEGEVLITLQQLTTARSQSGADEARGRLVTESSRSPECRSKVIATIMRTMDKPNLDFTGDPSSFALWTDGAKMLGELKAEESLDLLISHLGSNNGVLSTSMSHHPAFEGIIRMGPTAVPKLSATLKTSPDRNMRRYALYCIARIGGPSAKRALEEALPSESDSCISRFIRVSLDTINVESAGLKDDTVKWFIAFQCR